MVKGGGRNLRQNLEEAAEADSVEEFAPGTQQQTEGMRFIY